MVVLRKISLTFGNGQTGVMTGTTAGSSYSASNINSQGGNDWVLVLQASLWL
jgi:hypothetical protein